MEVTVVRKSRVVAHTHTHLDWKSVDLSLNLMHMSLGYGRKLECLEKTNANAGRT